MRDPPPFVGKFFADALPSKLSVWIIYFPSLDLLLVLESFMVESVQVFNRTQFARSCFQVFESFFGNVVITDIKSDEREVMTSYSNRRRLPGGRGGWSEGAMRDDGVRDPILSSLRWLACIFCGLWDGCRKHKVEVG